jgi:4-diphosphocytidyl-2-C-methyl-D-erythritol kinase
MSTVLADCPAPAKLNLFLHVTGRRADGYHLLQTVFQLIDLSDRLHLERRADGRIRRVTPVPGVPEEADLTVRAALALQAASGSRWGADIHLDKRIPMGGGLGGGSSDAATVLIALHRLWDLGMGRRRLMELGLALGADVPFFLFGRNAFAEGIGEALQPLTLAPRWYLVAKPPVEVPTQVIFQAPELTRNSASVKMLDFSAGALDSNALWGRNDLEPVASNRFPAVAAALSAVGRVGAARMTGSGACVFAAYDSEAAAKKAAGRLSGAEEIEGLWVARGLDAHPLESWLSERK